MRQAEIARIEARLGVRLPEEYRAAWLAGRSFSAVEAWQLRFPSELCWCADVDIPFLEEIRGVLLGENMTRSCICSRPTTNSRTSSTSCTTKAAKPSACINPSPISSTNEPSQRRSNDHGIVHEFWQIDEQSGCIGAQLRQ